VSSPIDILLVDDQELLRMGFRMVLDAQPDMRVIGEADNGLACPFTGAREDARAAPVVPGAVRRV
jgi:DNA-binding NarL/FixJ family response regulator